jgi:NAD(P)-dependent dehydrogenase (short-subunit alcohol dehydrogenase family)
MRGTPRSAMGNAMKLRHPLTGDTYTQRDHDTVLVEDSDGRSGVFTIKGEWIRGEVREADPHTTGIVCAPDMRQTTVNSRSGGGSNARQGVPIPTLDNDPTSFGRSEEMDLGLSGKKVLITAASRGIGLATAKTFADAGCDLAICARGDEGLESARKELESRGARVFTRAFDVAAADALKSFVEDAAADFGGLDVFVSNASGGAGPGEEAWRAGFEVDVMSGVRGVEAALPFLSESEAGSIVFISSTAALEYLGIAQGYNAMKAAVIAHASDLSQALASRGIRVNVVSPGPIFFEGGNWEMIQQAMPKIYEAALGQCAIGRMGAPEEVARAVVFLSSPAASLITGANLVADGGFTKRVAY